MNNIIVVTHHPRTINLQRVYAHLEKQFGATIIRLEKNQLKHLAACLPEDVFLTEAPVLLDLLLKPMLKQVRLFRRIKRPVFYIEDGCQDSLPRSPWRGKFMAFYKQLPHARIIHTGYAVSDYFRAGGVDSVCVPKGYDHHAITNRNVDRDIALGFIGRVKSDVYSERKTLLTRLQDSSDLKILRTEYGEDYVAMLNRIHTFVSADVGLGEYMAKNFEAMGAGCLLLAWRQDRGEEERLGLVDGVNCLLYSSAEEALQKIDWIRHHPAEADVIARRGESLVNTRFNFEQMANAIANAALTAPLVCLPRDNIYRRLQRLLRL